MILFSVCPSSFCSFWFNIFYNWILIFSASLVMSICIIFLMVALEITVYILIFFCSLFRGTIVPLHGKCRNFNHTYLYIPSVFLKMLLGSYVVFSFLFSSRNFLSYSLFLFFFFLFGCMACRLLVPWPGIKPAPSAADTQSFNHWTAKEVPIPSVFYVTVVVCIISNKIRNTTRQCYNHCFKGSYEVESKCSLLCV